MKLNERITRHFTWKEMVYRHKGTIYMPTAHAANIIQLNCVMILEPLRKYMGDKPITILPGGAYDPIYDKKGRWISHRSSPTTKHNTGALDIRIAGWDMEKAYRFVNGRFSELGIGGGLGWYEKDNFLHIDLRITRARW